MSIIEAEDGLIAFDTGDTKHDGEVVFEVMRTVTKKPIKVTICGHSYRWQGLACRRRATKDVMVIGHPNLNAVVKQNMGTGGAPASYPEVGPVSLRAH